MRWPLMESIKLPQPLLSEDEQLMHFDLVELTQILLVTIRVHFNISHPQLLLLPSQLCLLAEKNSTPTRHKHQLSLLLVSVRRLKLGHTTIVESSRSLSFT